MRSEILICKDDQNRKVDCKDIEFPDGPEYIPGTAELWTEWVGRTGIIYMIHILYMKINLFRGSDRTVPSSSGTMLYTMLIGPATIKKQ